MRQKKRELIFSEKIRLPDKGMNCQKGNEKLIYPIPLSILILKTRVIFGGTATRDGVPYSALQGALQIIIKNNLLAGI